MFKNKVGFKYHKRDTEHKYPLLYVKSSDISLKELEELIRASQNLTDKLIMAFNECRDNKPEIYGEFIFNIEFDEYDTEAISNIYNKFMMKEEEN